jgi:hypothetical protein
VNENENGVVIDTQVDAPAEGASTQTEQPDKQTSAVNSVADAFASAEAEQDGDDGNQTDTAEHATDQEPKVEHESRRQPKYKTLEDAEKANQEAQRKITELSEKLARIEKGEAPAKPNAKADTQDDEGDGEGDDEPLPELSDEEFAELARTDPLAARRYDRAMNDRKLEEKLKPITEKARQEAAAAQEMAEVAHFDKVETSYDSDYGKGTFSKLQAQISDPASLKALVESNPIIGKTLNSLYKAGDRVATVEFLIREAHLFNQRAAEARKRRSVPSGNGSGVSTRPNAKVTDMASAFDAAEKEI